MIVALVGLCGSGKSEASKYFEQNDYTKIYFGGITMDVLKERSMEINEKNERMVREELRRIHGMAAYAVLSLPKIEHAIKNKKNVLIDGLYSWSEFKVLKNKYPDILLIAIYTNPELRFERLSKRELRPLTKAQAISRDISEIENLEKAGPIAVANYTVINNGSIEELLDQIKGIMA